MRVIVEAERPDGLPGKLVIISVSGNKEKILRKAVELDGNGRVRRRFLVDELGAPFRGIKLTK